MAIKQVFLMLSLTMCFVICEGVQLSFTNKTGWRIGK